MDECRTYVISTVLTFDASWYHTGFILNRLSERVPLACCWDYSFDQSDYQGKRPMIFESVYFLKIFDDYTTLGLFVYSLGTYIIHKQNRL